MQKSIFLIAFAWCAGANAACPIRKASDILNCAIATAPNIANANALVPVAKINADLARRWLNPELELGGGYSAEYDAPRGMQYDAALMFTIETPARRGARTGRANAEYAAANISAEEQKEAVASSVMAALNRLRQLDRELAVLAEATATFGKVIKKYKSRPALSPEDKVSLELFQIALNVNKIEHDRARQDQRILKTGLATILGVEIPGKFKPFLSAPSIWPDLSAAEISADSVDLSKENITFDIAKANYLDAKSAMFPGIRVGPYAGTRPGDFGKIDTFGVKMAIPVPFFSGGKNSEMGKMMVDAAEQSMQFKKTAMANDFTMLKEKYRVGVKSISGIDITVLEKSHATADKMFASGRISSSLFIEAHRQVLDGIKTYHEYEMETLGAMWRIYALQHKLLTNLKELYHE